MEKHCQNCQKTFEASSKDLEFLAQMEVCEPSLCYLCRMQRRLANRNERFLYHRKCDLSGKQIISCFSVDKPFPVYDIDVWWSERWDALEYGSEFDFDRPFFEQFVELRNRVPRLGLQQQRPMENSAYCNCASRNKNCYLVFSTNQCEDCYYGAWVNGSKDCVDNLNIEECELCYECVGCRECYNLRYSRDCTSCHDSVFLRDCIGCSNCFGCTSLVNRNYFLFNEDVGKANYNSFMSGLDTGSHSSIEKLKNEIEHALGLVKVKELHGTSLEDCSGDYLRNCRGVYCSFECDDSEDLTYCMCINKAKSSMDHSYWGVNSELVYECQACGYDLFNLRFCNLCWSNCSELTYCDHCFSTKSSFGCVGLRQSEYCILNKQYSKKDYEELRLKIISHMKQTGEWGEFFPIHHSAYAYNESVAQEHVPLTKGEVLQKGWQWHTDHEEKKSAYLGPRVEPADNIRDADNSLCQKILRCEQTKRPYKIAEPELKFYQKMNIPLPRLCPDARHARRLTFRNPRILWTRSCHSCEKSIQTSYAPARPERVYCEACYKKEIS